MMLTTSNAKIYLSDKRGFTQSVTHQSFHTFNFGAYADLHHQPFVSLQTLNDEILAAQKSIVYTMKEPTEVIILPLIGGCVCTVRENVTQIDAGEIFRCVLDEKNVIELNNRFKEEAINYLYMEFPSTVSFHSVSTRFEIEKKVNRLHQIMSSANGNFYLGIYNGREESSLTYKDTKHFFVFVIEGVFEVNNRLLHRRDGLALCNTHLLEFEALSNQAIILVIELY